jgi:nucleoside-diphosphate-sugar epimerase
MSVPKILVFGATGNVGSQVCRALIRRKVPFRAIVHTPSKGESLKKEGAGLVEIVEGKMNILGKSTEISRRDLRTIWEIVLEILSQYCSSRPWSAATVLRQNLQYNLIRV